MDYKEKLKGIIDSDYTPFADINVFLKYFPELKESEDEKIRKYLLKCVEKTIPQTFASEAGLKKDNIIAWLEKLGKQTSVLIIPKFRVGDEIKTSNEESLTITKIDEKGYWSGDLFICSFEDSVKWELNQFTPKQANVLDKHIDKLLKSSDEKNIYKNGVYQETNGVRIWHNGYTFFVPKNWNKGEWPLLNEKGDENSEKNKKRIMNEINALLDWDFVAATKHIQNLGTDIPLKDEEYLITAPIWLAMYEHKIALNKALSNIGAMEIDFNKDFWFAQRSGVNYAWIFLGASKAVNLDYIGNTNQVITVMV